MCDPLTIGGIALQAGSMLMNSMAESRAAKARSGAMEAERTRQRMYDQEAAALNNQSRQQYEGYGAKQDERAAKLGDFLGSQNQQAPADAPSESIPVSSNIVAEERTKQFNKTKEYSDKQSKALGNLRSFGDLVGDLSLVQARNSGQVNTLGGFKRGSSAVLPYELEAAKNKGSGLKLFGDVLGIGGGLATNAGLSGKSIQFGA